MAHPSPQFGYFLDPSAGAAHATLDTASLLDEVGFDVIGIQDHPYQARFLDTWTLLSAIGARTHRIRLFPDVACLPLRPPAVLAKSVASLDVLTGGRVELGLGAGAFWDAIAAMGGPRRRPGEARRALVEAVEIIRLMWSGQRAVTYEGDFYTVKGVHPGPVPAHRVGVWLGAYGPKMLDFVGAHADGWVPSLGYVDDDSLREAGARIDAAAERAGRDPASIRRVLNVGDLAREPDLDARLIGFVREHRIDTFLFDGPGDEASLRRLADTVLPRVRDALV
ncbi:LLM class flavin-dependent oxidoreductase [Rhodococcus sp. HNM0569]|uniref:LLM class flavin-dependent oxidoreductase n=1 Tax=Rhodococcus sp. HNM0569 TaxID=2716340 RepID=UPI00146E0442|nr:LLM class flavin-dependent oxidoreductase [Rhodococcus sp. HNM0569]NLU83411.1 LLM class flavin-dependent oxidoreductase [Rhodococcus sp. HNM0569]